MLIDYKIILKKYIGYLIEFKNELNDYSNEINTLKKEVIEFTNKFPHLCKI